MALAGALEVNTSLTALDLRSTSVGNDVGAEALGRALRVNTSLTSLNISDNSFTPAGIVALVDAIQDNAFLVSVSYNLSSYPELDSLRNWRAMNSGLFERDRILHLSSLVRSPIEKIVQTPYEEIIETIHATVPESSPEVRRVARSLFDGGVLGCALATLPKRGL